MAPQVNRLGTNPLCGTSVPVSNSWVVRSQLWAMRILPNSALIPRRKCTSGKDLKESSEILLIKSGSISSCLKSQAFLSLFGKNSNWVKYRKFTTSPFYLLLHLCTGFINDDSGNWLGFGALVSYLMWGSSWENIHTCHSWALLQRGPPLGFSPFAKGETALGACDRTLKREAFLNLLF